MKKKRGKVQMLLSKKISDRLSYTIISLVVVIALGVVVYAQALPNPGHTAAQIQPPSGCVAGQILQWTGSAWTCITLQQAQLDEEVPKTFVGATTQTYTGSGVGGYSGGNDKCASQFGAGARMATSADFINGRPTVSGWYSSFNLGSSGDLTGDASFNDCVAWTSSASTAYGPQWLDLTGIGGGSTPYFASCTNALRIICVQ